MTSPRQAAEIAASVEEMLTEYAAGVRGGLAEAAGPWLDPGWLEALAPGGTQRPLAPVPNVSAKFMDLVTRVRSHVIALKHWRRHRMVVLFDPDLLEVLDRAGLEALPPDVMHALPYPDPMVVLPEPVRVPKGDDEGSYYEVQAFLVFGIVLEDEPVVVSTHADLSDINIGILFVGPGYTSDGRPLRTAGGDLDHLMLRFKVDPTAKSIDDMVAKMIRTYDQTLHQADPNDFMPTLVRRAVSALIYLVSVDAELDKVPAVAARGRSQAATKGKPVKVVQVGYRVGERIRQARTYVAKDYEHTDRKQSPHTRRPHPHIYRVGPGRMNIEVKILGLIEVNMKSGDAEVTTIRRVRKPRLD